MKNFTVEDIRNLVIDTYAYNDGVNYEAAPMNAEKSEWYPRVVFDLQATGKLDHLADAVRKANALPGMDEDGDLYYEYSIGVSRVNKELKIDDYIEFTPQSTALDTSSEIVLDEEEKSRILARLSILAESDCNMSLEEMLDEAHDRMQEFYSDGVDRSWKTTDDDSCQMVRKLSDDTYELYQITNVGEHWPKDKFSISHAIIDVNEVDVDRILEAYAYDNLDAIKEVYGDAYKQILAECDFELDAYDYLITNKEMPYNEAEEYIRRMTGKDV